MAWTLAELKCWYQLFWTPHSFRCITSTFRRQLLHVLVHFTILFLSIPANSFNIHSNQSNCSVAWTLTTMATWTSRSSTRQQWDFSVFPFWRQPFLQALQLLSSKTTEQKLQWAFRLYDEDNSGLIDKDEMANIMMVTTYFIVIMTSLSIMLVWQHKITYQIIVADAADAVSVNFF